MEDQKSILWTKNDDMGLVPELPSPGDAQSNCGDEKLPANQEAPPFSIFTKREKWALVAITSVAGLFSPLAANIYFPAIPVLAKEFNVSINLMNQTLTVYMIGQGISPVAWALLADIKGRRPVFLACLLLLTASCVGLALVPTNAFWLLMLLRIVQATGSAATLALGAGVVSDIAEPAERGGFVGLSVVAPMLGPCIGPIIGGVLAGQLGWRWIFWCLCIMSTSCFVFLLLLFPETLRRVVGNGSLLAPWWNRPLLPLIGPYRRNRISPDQEKSPQSPSSTAIAVLPSQRVNMNPFRLLVQPDIIIILVATGTTFAAFIIMPSTTAALFEEAYPHLTLTQIGLCFLPMGVGCMIGTLTSGALLDRAYGIARRNWEGDGSEAKPEHSFHIEKARLSITMIYLAIMLSCNAGFGWCVGKHGPLAVSLVLQFVGGWSGIGVMNCFQTLLMDLFPKQGSSITALNNVMRCTLGAVAVSIIDILLRAMGTGWTFVLITGFVAVVAPSLTIIEIRKGPQWRMRRMGIS